MQQSAPPTGASNSNNNSSSNDNSRKLDSASQKSRQEGSTCLGKKQGVLLSHVAPSTLTQAERQLLHFLQTQQQSGEFLNQIVNVIQSRGVSQSTPTYPSRRIPVLESSEQQQNVDDMQDSPGHRRQHETQILQQLEQVEVQSDLVGEVSGELREQPATSVSGMQTFMTPSGLRTIEQHETTMSETVDQEFSLLADGLPQQLPAVIQQQQQQVQQDSGVSDVSVVASGQVEREDEQWYPDWRYMLQPLSSIRRVHRQIATTFQEYMIQQYGSIEAAILAQELRDLNIQSAQNVGGQVEQQQQHSDVASVAEVQQVGQQQLQAEISQVGVQQDGSSVQQVDVHVQQQFVDVQQHESGVQDGEISQVEVLQSIPEHEQQVIRQQVEQVMDEAFQGNPEPSFQELQQIEDRVRALLPPEMQPSEPLFSQQTFDDARRLVDAQELLQQSETAGDDYERDLANREREIALQQQELQLQREQLQLERERFELEQLRSSRQADSSISSCDACKSDVLRAHGVDVGLSLPSQPVFIDHGVPLGESGVVSKPTLVPATLKLDKPQSFSGKHSEIKNFIFQIKQYIDSVNLGHGSDACRFITSFFKGDALNWWRSYSLTHDPVFENLTVDVLLSELESQFSDLDHEMKVRNRLFNIRQLGNVQNYVNLFRSLQVELGSKRLKGEDEMHVFVSGLKPYPKQQVLISSPDTLELAIHTAERAEQAQQSANESRGYTGSSSNNRGGNNGYRGGRFNSQRGNFGGSRGGFNNFRGGYNNFRGGYNNFRGNFNRGVSNNFRGGGRSSFVPYNQVSQYNDSGYRGDAPMVVGTVQVNSRGGGNPGSRAVVCFYCGKSGHVKKDCFKLKHDMQNGSRQPGKSANFAGFEAPQQQQFVGVGSSGANSNVGMQANTVQVQPGVTFKLGDGTIVQGVKAPKAATTKN